MSIKSLRVGEIICINNKEFIIANTEHKNGRMVWDQPTLIKLKTLIKNINRKPYYKKMGFKDTPLKYMKRFKGIKFKVKDEMKGGIK